MCPSAGSDTCHFCEAPATAVCEWKTGLHTFQRLELSEVVVGDTVEGYIGESGRKRHARVLQITERPGGIGYRTLLLELIILNTTRSTQKTWGGNCWELLNVYRPGKCETPVCEAHHRDHGAIVCMNHWKDLETVKL